MNITLRPMEDCDFDDYICLQREVYFDKSLLESDSQKNSTWDSIMKDAGCHYAIIEQKSQCFLGCCAINNKEAPIPEISIEILQKYRRKGVGYQAVCALMKKTSIKTHKKCFLYKVEPDNYESLLLVRKLKGRPLRLERNIFLSDKYISKFETAMADCVDEKLKKIAEAFQCDVTKLMSHILVFQIELENIEETNISPADKEIRDIHSERKISKAIREFDKYMWMTELLDIMETESSVRQGKLNEMKAEIENEIKKIERRK